jgi:hypothetical protein
MRVYLSTYADCLASRVPIRAAAQNKSSLGGRQMEVLPLCHGKDVAGYARHILEVRATGKEQRYDSCLAIPIQWRAS